MSAAQGRWILLGTAKGKRGYPKTRPLFVHEPQPCHTRVCPKF
jgi:hypothetical protein